MSKEPADPTEEMIEAGLRVDLSNEDERAVVINVWHAMASASPTPPEAQAVAWLWRAKVRGEWGLWSAVEVDPNDWTWREYWDDLEIRALYLRPAAIRSGEQP